MFKAKGKGGKGATGDPTVSSTTADPENRQPSPNQQNYTNGHNKAGSQVDPNANSRPKLTFHCQQAQGSPTGIISGFTNVKELYQKIANCYDMNPSEVGQF